MSHEPDGLARAEALLAEATHTHRPQLGRPSPTPEELIAGVRRARYNAGWLVSAALGDVAELAAVALRPRPIEEQSRRYCPLAAGTCQAPSCAFWGASPFIGGGLCMWTSSHAAAVLDHKLRAAVRPADRPTEGEG